MKHTLLATGTLAATLAALGSTTALAGMPYPTRSTPRAADAGPLPAAEAQTPLTVTVALKLHNLASAEVLMHRVATKGDPLYRHFLTPAEFARQFGPTDADVATVRDALAPYGLTVRRATTTTLKVTGVPAAMEHAFNVSLHEYAVPAQGSVPGYRFRAPAQRPVMPAAMQAVAHAVLGLANRPALTPHMLHTLAGMRPSQVRLNATSSGAGTPPDAPGVWTTTDFAAYYNVKPLYKAGVTGAGQTIGIMTFAAFTPSDDFTYWSSIGLTVNPNRITIVPVDGGSGAPSDAAGSVETTLDTEQSGGIAPAANILVYEAPNTDQGFVDVFAQAIDDNKADALSISWGEWEWYDTLANAPVTNPTGGATTSTLTAVHELLVQANVQGETTYASAGDAGAYDANDQATPPDFSLALSVDYPASDTAITAAGGTTVPATITFTSPAVTVTIPKERVWSWDYLVPLCTDLQLDPISCGIFPVGGGGGVSIHFPLPPYQGIVAGTQSTQPNQQFLDEDTVPATLIYTLPANYAGRNVPDISLNSDPETGYIIGYTSSAPGSSYGVLENYGGTSFAAPQFNGVTQLLAQNAGARLGQLNPAIYHMAQQLSGYTGKTAPFRYITTGNNDFYVGRKGYNPGAGLGTIDAANLAAATK